MKLKRFSFNFRNMDLDLNQEPLDSPDNSMLVEGLGSILNDIETAHVRIEERIRQLEAVTSRARQRQRWRQSLNSPRTMNSDAVGPMAATTQEENVENNSKSRKRGNSHLVANALEMDNNVKSDGDGGGGFFDCNICLDSAKEPVLTCCGHLFCWPCFYQVEQVQSNLRECPVCKGEVSDSNITPIYSSGSKKHKFEDSSGVKFPPRPQARRIESARQQLVNQGLPSVPINETIRRPSTNRGVAGGGTDPTRIYNFATFRHASSLGEESIRELRVRQVSRLLSHEAHSLTTLSSTLSTALTSAERIVQDLETLFNNPRPLRRGEMAVLDDRDSLTSVAAVISQTADNATEINSRVPHSSTSSSRRTNDAPVGVTPSLPNSSSSSRRRRRTNAMSTSDVDGGVSRELRRRRLR